MWHRCEFLLVFYIFQLCEFCQYVKFDIHFEYDKYVECVRSPTILDMTHVSNVPNTQHTTTMLDIPSKVRTSILNALDIGHMLSMPSMPNLVILPNMPNTLDMFNRSKRHSSVKDVTTYVLHANQMKCLTPLLKLVPLLGGPSPPPHPPCIE